MSEEINENGMHKNLFDEAICQLFLANGLRTITKGWIELKLIKNNRISHLYKLSIVAQKSIIVKESYKKRNHIAFYDLNEKTK